MTAAVLYGAKSTEDKHESIPTQLDEASELAEREGWEVVGSFHDEGSRRTPATAGQGWPQPSAERWKRLASAGRRAC